MRNRTCAVCDYEMSSWNALRRTFNTVKCPNCGQKNKIANQLSFFIWIGMGFLFIALALLIRDPLVVALISLLFLLMDALIEVALFHLEEAQSGLNTRLRKRRDMMRNRNCVSCGQEMSRLSVLRKFF